VGVRGSSDATVTLDRVDAAWLAALAHLPPASGTLAGRLALAGTGSAPRANAQITVTDLNVEGIPYGTLALDATAADGRATVHGGLRHPTAGELRADGTVPASLAWADPRPARRDAPVDVRLHADALDASALRVLAPDAVRRIGGRLAIDARVHGPWSALGVDGTAALSAGRLELVATGVPYEDVRVRLRAAGRTVDVIELHARAGTGSADGQGRVLLPGSTPSVLDVRVALREFLAVRAPEYEGDVSGTLLVRGGLFVPEVVGDLDVVRALLRPAALPATDPPLARDPTITVVGLPAGPATTPASTGSLADALRLALDIRLTREVWIRRDDAGIELGGALRLDKSAGGPVRLNGEVRLVRGWYAFQGRRFTLEPDGTVRFTGPLPPHPALDVTATYRAPQYRILVHVGGTSEKPSLTLTSDPPLAEADILSVLLFGKPASELGRSESLGLQRQALQLASGYVAPELRTSVLDALALETLDVELPGGPDRPGGPDQPGRVSVSRHVASDVFLSLAQEFGGRNAQLVGVEYALTPRISVKGSTSTRGDTAVDVFWHRRY